MQPIKITCSPTIELRLPLDELIPIQGELKILTSENYEKLKKSILTHGFKFPMFVWKEVTTVQTRVLGGKPTTTIKWYVLDGHGRRRVLQHLRDDDGHEIPPIPCVEITADTLGEAKKLVLLISSQYHTITEDGLYEFMSSGSIDLSFLEEETADLVPSIEVFKNNFFQDPAPEDSDKDEWKGMPEFTQEDKTGVRSVIVHFKTLDDKTAFMKTIGQTLTDKTRSIWFPEAEIERLMDKRYVSES